MKIAIGCDHIVTDIKNKIIEYLKGKDIEVEDYGTYDSERTHYPIYGRKVALAVSKKEADLGIVLCGTGVGISNAANKVEGARVALVRDPYTAKKAKEDYNINILAFGGRVIGMGVIEQCIDLFLETEYKGKNEELIHKINQISSGENYDDPHLFDSFIRKWDEGFYHD